MKTNIETEVEIEVFCWEKEDYVTMSPLEALDYAKQCGREEGHMIADSIVAIILDNLGYGDVVEAYYDVPKWYA